MLAIAASAGLAQQPALRAAVIQDQDIRIDGRLDDLAWANATAVTLTQQSPHPGAASPYATTLRVFADRGTRCSATVVWNRGWTHAIGDDEARFAPLADQFLVKLRWIFRR